MNCDHKMHNCQNIGLDIKFSKQLNETINQWISRRTYDSALL